jgi:hypothetical protein
MYKKGFHIEFQTDCIPSLFSLQLFEIDQNYIKFIDIQIWNVSFWCAYFFKGN